MYPLDRYCPYAKIYGERNSGTNFVEALIHANFLAHCLQSNNKVNDYVKAVGRELPKKTRGTFRNAIVDIDCERILQSEFGWKHGIPPLAEISAAPHRKHTLFICIAKHPVAWLQSLFERPYNPIERPPQMFSEFIRYLWPLTKRDNIAATARINVVHLWNRKNLAFQTLPGSTERCIVTAYEHILAQPADFLHGIARYLHRRDNALIWSLPSTKGENMTFESYRRKYDLMRICGSVSTEDLEYIRELADPQVMRAFGYRWP